MHYLKLLKENPMRLFYYVQGSILWFVHKKYILKYLQRSVECNDCFVNGSCKHCGCDVNKLFLSDLKCKKDVG